MKSVICCLLCSFLLLEAAVAVATGVPFDLRPNLTRNDADKMLSKNYEWTILEDMTVRREWRKDGVRAVMDFYPRDNSCIYLQFSFAGGIPVKEAKEIASALTGNNDLKFRKLKAEKQHALNMGKSIFSVLQDGSFLFLESGGSKRIARIFWFKQQPAVSRADLQEGTEGGKTALGNRGDAGVLTMLRSDEQRRMSASPQGGSSGAIASNSAQGVRAESIKDDRRVVSNASSRTDAKKGGVALREAQAANRDDEEKEVPEPLWKNPLFILGGSVVVLFVGLWLFAPTSPRTPKRPIKR